MIFRTVRIVLSVLILISFLSGFVINYPLFKSISSSIASWQFFPSLVAVCKAGVMSIAFAIVLMVTLFFGRIYCSLICPLGTIQDVATFLSRKKRTYKAFPLLMRYAIPLVAIVLFVFGVSMLIGITEPYSIISRVFRLINGYSGHHLKSEHTLITIAALLILLLIIILSVFRGRFYCNTFCPTGAILSLFSYFPILGIRLNKDKCVSCGKCAKSCKAECIDIKNKRVENSRCISCFNCLGKCKFGAIKYSIIKRRTKFSSTDSQSYTDGRRSFIGLIVLGILTYPFSKLFRNKLSVSPIVPPGSQSLRLFTEECTACHLCVAQCPTNVLKPSLFEFGIGGMMQPRLDYNAGYCDYNCNICSLICPAKAIKPVSLTEKQNISIGLAAIDESICIPYAQGTSCAACDEMCPTGATHMIKYKDGLPAPIVDKDICIGCGACQKACPVLPSKAITVSSREIHTKIDPLKPTKSNSKNNISDFAF